MTTAFAIEKPLLSIEESTRLCPGSGFDGNDECNQELDPHEAELCAQCLAVEVRHYRDLELQREVEEGYVARSQQYSYLKDRK